MGKIWVEVCLISARGLRRKSLLKLQWFAVGWIDPNNKYCTKIDASGNANPVWKTKFSVPVDTSESNFQDLALHVEVHCRESIFLRESLVGTANIVLKEFLNKYINKNSQVPKPVEEVGSFQLRKKNSDKPQGFVDVSVRVSEEREDPVSSYPGGQEGIHLLNYSSGINLATGNRPFQADQPIPSTVYQKPSYTQTSNEYAHPMPIPPNYSHPSVGGPSYAPATGLSYQPLQISPTSPPPPPPPPPPPFPPSNIGYTPTYFPRIGNMPPSYINTSSSGAAPPGHNGMRPGFGVGMGAGALVAGAMIFGNDFMSGFDIPGGSREPSLTISADPPL